MFQFSGIGSLAVAAFAMCCGLAALLYRVGTPGSVARKLSLLLVVEGVTLVSTGYIDLFLSPTTRANDWYPVWLRSEEIVHTFGDCAMLALYPPFLAAALRTKLTQPFGRKSVRLAITSVAAVLFVMVLWGPVDLSATTLYLSLTLLFAFALVASIHAWHTSAGTARTRAGTFAIAFGVRDICWGFAYGGAIWMIWIGQYRVVDPDASGAPYLIYALGTLLAVPLIAYGILRTQLFDIDLRIRWTLKQSTLAAVFITFVYLISEGAERLLSAELGNIAGLLASAIVVFFLVPLQRFAERVASMAMPNTQNTPEYAAYRKMQVYEAALDEARQGGGISAKERALLEHLRDSLGISPVDALALEDGLSSPRDSATEQANP
ncbi:MAG: hypothetical protein ACR2QU_08365 [Gammaproteobacteria bacterium]